MRDHDLWIVFDEDLGPEVLDEGIGEEAEAHPAVVFSESLGEEDSVDLMRQARDWSADSAGEEHREHFDDTLLVLQSCWQLEVPLDECGDMPNVMISGPVYV